MYKMWYGVPILTVKGLNKIAGSKTAQARDFQLCRTDPAYWLFNYAFTFDEHDDVKSEKLFPRKRYLFELTRLWEVELMFICIKCRQVMISWWAVALHLQLAMGNNHRRVFVQSKKFEDANALLDRMWHIYRNLPPWLKQKPFVANRIRGRGLIDFPGLGSEVRAVAQGGDQIRSYVPTAVLSDEICFQPEAEDAYSASLPCIKGGGRFTAVTTILGGTFGETLWEDRLNDETRILRRKQIIEGLSAAHCTNGVLSVKLEHTVYPEKYTPEMLEELAAQLPDHQFRREILIDGTARGGTPVYPMFSHAAHVRHIVPQENWQYYGSLDHGRTNPTAFLSIAVDDDSNLHILDEYYEANHTISENCLNIVTQFGDKHGSMSKYRSVYADPSIWAKADNENRTKAQLYGANGVRITRAKNAIDAGINKLSQYLLSSLARWSLEREELHSYFKRNSGNTKATWKAVKDHAEHPALYIHPRCVNLLAELPALKWKERRIKTGENLMEKPEDRDDHACDALRYATMAKMRYVKLGEERAPRNTYMRLIQDAQQRHEDEIVNRRFIRG